MLQTLDRVSERWREAVDAIPGYEVVDDGKIFRTSFLDSFVFSSEHSRALDLLRGMMAESEGRPIRHVLPGKEVETGFGPAYCIEARAQVPDLHPDGNQVRERILEEFRLLAGVGPVTVRRLRGRGYRSIQDSGITGGSGRAPVNFSGSLTRPRPAPSPRGSPAGIPVPTPWPSPPAASTGGTSLSSSISRRWASSPGPSSSSASGGSPDQHSQRASTLGTGDLRGACSPERRPRGSHRRRGGLRLVQREELRYPLYQRAGSLLRHARAAGPAPL